MIGQDWCQPADLNRHDDGDGTVLGRTNMTCSQGVRDSKIHIPAPVEAATIEAATVIHRHIEATTTRIH